MYTRCNSRDSSLNFQIGLGCTGMNCESMQTILYLQMHVLQGSFSRGLLANARIRGIRCVPIMCAHLYYQVCEQDGCKTRPSFNYPGATSGVRCGRHQEAGTVVSKTQQRQLFRQELEPEDVRIRVCCHANCTQPYKALCKCHETKTLQSRCVVFNSL